MKFAFITLLALSSAVAFADQCVLVPHQTALNAARIIRQAKMVAEKCEPCGERRASIRTVSSARVVRRGNLSEVVVNGTPVDLAYTFSYVRPGVFQNVAGTVGCMAVGVSDFVCLGNSCE